MFFAPYEFKIPAVQLDTLCARYTLLEYYCPSKHNPLQIGLESWDYSISPPVGFLSDGFKLEAISFDKCKVECAGHYKGTAYVKAGNENWGLAVEQDDTRTSNDEADTDTSTSNGAYLGIAYISAFIGPLAALWWGAL